MNTSLEIRYQYTCIGKVKPCSSKMVEKVSSFFKKLMYVLKMFRVTAGNIHSFRIRSKETLWIMYPKYPVLDMIQRK